MVLEGLRRADRFCNLLRTAGFIRPDKKVYKSEHFDKEFDNKQYSTVLLQLIHNLEERILSTEETERLQEIDKLGLLDDTFFADYDDEECVDSNLVNEKLQFEEQLIEYYNEKIEKEEYKKILLERELEEFTSHEIKNIKHVDASIFESFSSIKSSQVKDTFSEFFEAFKILIPKLEKILQAIVKPIDNNDLIHPELRFKMVTNEELFRNPWHPDDKELYMNKITKALSILKEHGIEVTETITSLLYGDRILERIRNQNNQILIEKLEDIILMGNALQIIFIKLIYELFELVEICKNEIESISIKLNRIVTPFENFLNLVEPVKPNPLVQLESSPENVDINPEFLQILKSFENQSKGLGNFIDEVIKGGEVNPVTNKLVSFEVNLRDQSLQLSNILQEICTITTRISLQLKN